MNSRRFSAAMTTALRRHLATGRLPSLPAGGDLVWRWFIDLARARGMGFAGPLPITYAEIEAYRRLSGWPIERRHVDIIFALDRVYLDRAHAKADPAPGVPRSSGQAVSPSAFDAVFGGAG